MSNLTEAYIDSTTFPISKVTRGMNIIIGESHIDILKNDDEVLNKKAYVLGIHKCNDCEEQERCGGYYIQAHINASNITTSICYRSMYAIENGRHKLIVPDKV